MSPVSSVRHRGHPAHVLGAGSRGVCDLMAEILGGAGLSDLSAALEVVKPPRVYRWTFRPGARWKSVVLKRLDGDVACRTRAVTERWLPSLGLQDTAARLLGAAEGEDGEVWHIYEDLGDATLAHDLRPRDVQRTIDVVARLHTRAAGRPLLTEARRMGRSLGVEYFEENVADALRAVRQVVDSAPVTTLDQVRLLERLEGRLHSLLADLEWRKAAFVDLRWPETLLHGDVWPINVSVAGPVVRLLDWDKVGVGPASYDVSAFLMRFPRDERAPILRRYLRAVGEAGWPIPSDERLEALFDTHERARYANRVIWPSLALVDTPSGWEFPELVEVERWFETLDASVPIVANR